MMYNFHTRNTLSSAVCAARGLRTKLSTDNRRQLRTTGTTDSVADLNRESTPLSFHDMPGPTTLENIQTYRKEGFTKHHLIVRERFEKYGPTFKFKIPGRTMVFTCDPDNIEKVFRAEGYPADRGNALVGLMSYFVKGRGLKEGILGTDGESWHAQRSEIATKVLRPIALKPFTSELCAVSDDTIASFKEGPNLGVFPELMKWSTEGIGVMSFGCRIGVNDATPNKMALDFIQGVCDYLEAESKLVFSTVPVYKYFKTPTLSRLYRSLDGLWNTTDYFVQKVKDQHVPLATKNLVQQLLDDGKLSEDEIIQIILVVFGGGVDTTANVLLNLLYALSEFPKVQQKLYEDIQQTLPNKETPTYQDLGKMPYLKAAIKESGRLLPTTGGTSRKLKEPIILSGYKVPEGTMIGLSLQPSSSMQKKTFGDDYECFKPERWLRAGSTKLHAFASLPFGFGPRMCIGKRIAELETSLFVVRLLQKYAIEVRGDEEEKMEWEFHLILSPTKPFNLNLKKRK